MNKKQPTNYGLGDCFHEYVQRKNKAKVPKSISYYKPLSDNQQDLSIGERPQWNAKVAAKLQAEQRKKAVDNNDPNNKKLQKSNIE